MNPPPPIALPLPDEPFVAAWEDYAREAAGRGLLETLREKLVQLRFPVAAGVRQTPAYLAATRRGVPPVGDAPAVRLERPDRLELRCHPTAAGRLPVLFTPWRRDFATLIQVFVHRGEPHPVPDSNGACLVAGLNNRDRVARLREVWTTAGTGGGEESEFFAYLKDHRPGYQDCFLLLGDNPRSGLDARTLGLDPEPWRQLSLTIRTEHEAAHYCARRLARLGDQAMFDELVADYGGVRRARGSFSADWLLRFMGLENFPAVRAGGRFANYRAASGESAEQVVAAARGLERFDHGCDPAVPEVFRLLAPLPLSLAELAGTFGPAWERRALASARTRYTWHPPAPQRPAWSRRSPGRPKRPAEWKPGSEEWSRGSVHPAS